MKKVLKYFLYIIIVFLITYNTILVTKKIFKPNEIPSFFGFKNFIVVSGSMEPTLNIGDIVFVNENKPIREKDIIAFKENNINVTHRVIEIVGKDGETLYRTKGDANNSIDSDLVTQDKIEGNYSFKIPRIGKIIIFLQTKLGLLIFLIVIFIIYVFLNMNGTKKEKKSKGKHAM